MFRHVVLLASMMGALGCAATHECVQGTTSSEGCGGCTVRVCRADGTWDECFGGGAACDAGSRPDVGVRDAGPADARSVDVGPPDVFIVLPDAGSVCSPAWAVCNTDADCFAWGARVGPPGTFFSSMCVSFHCTMGIAGCWTHDGNTHCQCAPGIECLFGQLCVSDVPGGPTRCVEACDGDGVHLDAGPAADWDGGPCDGRGMTWGTACTAEIDAECQRRATERAYGRYGYSRCVTLPGGTQSACADGDYCSDGPCRCTATRECGGDYEVCASDTPDGPHYCRPICAR